MGISLMKKMIHFPLPPLTSLWSSPRDTLEALNRLVISMERASSSSSAGIIVEQTCDFRDDGPEQRRFLAESSLHVAALVVYVEEFRELLERLRRIPGRRVFLSSFHCMGSLFELSLCFPVRVWRKTDVFLGLPESREGFYTWGGLIQDLGRNRELKELHNKDFLFRMTAWQAAQHGIIHTVANGIDFFGATDDSLAETPARTETTHKQFFKDTLELTDFSLRFRPPPRPEKLQENSGKNLLETERKSRFAFAYEKFSHAYQGWLARRSSQGQFEIAHPPRHIPLERLYVDVTQADFPALLARLATRTLGKLIFYGKTPARLTTFLNQLAETSLVPLSAVSWCYSPPLEGEAILKLGLRGEFLLSVGKFEVEGTRLFGNSLNAAVGWAEVYVKESLAPEMKNVLSLLCLGFVATPLDPNAPLSMRLRELFFAEVLYASRFSADRSLRQMLHFLADRGWMLPSEEEWALFLRLRNPEASAVSHEEIGLRHLRRKKSFSLMDGCREIAEVEQKLKENDPLPMNVTEKLSLSLSSLESHLLHFAALLFYRAKEAFPELSEEAIDTLVLHACGFPRLRGTPRHIFQTIGKNALLYRMKLTGVAV